MVLAQGPREDGLVVHGVAQRDLERLERPIERGADGRVPRVEPQRLLPVSLGLFAGGGEILTLRLNTCSAGVEVAALRFR